MMTLEKAICRLENIVSGSKQKFTGSELRTNTKEAAELLKFSFMTLLKVKKEDLKKVAYTNIFDTVFDDSPAPEYYRKGDVNTFSDLCKKIEKERPVLQDTDILNECIECCNVILKKMESDDVPVQGKDGMTVRTLSRSYTGKYLYFRDDEIGSQYVWVKNLHKNKEGHFEVDGTVIFTDGIDNIIGLYDVQNHPIEDFYNFGDKNDRFTSCEDLDEALHEPMDTRLKNHIVSCKEVVEDILFTFTWFYEIHIPELAKILKGFKLPN